MRTPLFVTERGGQEARRKSRGLVMCQPRCTAAWPGARSWSITREVKGRRLRQARPLRLCSGRRNDARARKGGIYGSVHLKAPESRSPAADPGQTARAGAFQRSLRPALLRGLRRSQRPSPHPPAQGRRGPGPRRLGRRHRRRPDRPPTARPGCPVKNRGAAHDCPQPGEAPGTASLARRRGAPQHMTSARAVSGVAVTHRAGRAGCRAFRVRPDRCRGRRSRRSRRVRRRRARCPRRRAARAGGPSCGGR